jgi:hypothetical protein
MDSPSHLNFSWIIKKEKKKKKTHQMVRVEREQHTLTQMETREKETARTLTSIPRSVDPHPPYIFSSSSSFFVYLSFALLLVEGVIFFGFKKFF